LMAFMGGEGETRPWKTNNKTACSRRKGEQERRREGTLEPAGVPCRCGRRCGGRAHAGAGAGGRRSGRTLEPKVDLIVADGGICWSFSFTNHFVRFDLRLARSTRCCAAVLKRRAYEWVRSARGAARRAAREMITRLRTARQRSRGHTPVIVLVGQVTSLRSGRQGSTRRAPEPPTACDRAKRDLRQAHGLCSPLLTRGT